MKPKFQSSSVLLSCLLSVIVFNSCGSKHVEETPEDVRIAVIPSMKEAQRHFYHAWLADCVNEEPYIGEERAIHDLTDEATKRINGAINNDTIKSFFGAEELLWGPVLSVNYVESSTDKYVVDNLMYCLGRKDSVGQYHFMVAIAGTDAISSFDWMDEDLDVLQQKPWLEGTMISAGAMNGYQNLVGFRDNGVGIDSFLRMKARLYPGMEVEVAGHSLGGALTQVMASHFNDQLKDVGSGISVTAWVYAGPTAGNKAFADSLVQQLAGYYAYDNTLDVVPHAWEMDQVIEICNLYNGFELCGNTMEPNIWIKGVARYIQALAANTGDYTQPVSSVPPFTGKHFLSADTTGCAAVLAGTKKAWGDSGYPIDLYQNLNSLSGQCGYKTDVTEPEFNQFAFFLAEMGAQHLNAYFDHFFDNTPIATSLPQYVPGNSGTFIDWDAADILSDFIENAAGYLKAQGISDCDCQSLQ
ncbi:MAG: hypothetical protein H6562_25280 [Lewinellaceae bacterium]|nr:hypothetical protein [Lewinellaceae bacterium]